MVPDSGRNQDFQTLIDFLYLFGCALYIKLPHAMETEDRLLNYAPPGSGIIASQGCLLIVIFTRAEEYIIKYKFTILYIVDQ